jgi:hypothetical protein
VSVPTTILEPSDISDLIRQPSINTPSAVQAIRMAEGWVAGATRISPWPPDPAPEDVRAWVLELAVMCYTDPVAMTTLSGEGDSAVRLQRREQILDAAHRLYAGEGRASGSFPRAECWPEPAVRAARRARFVQEHGGWW